MFKLRYYYIVLIEPELNHCIIMCVWLITYLALTADKFVLLDSRPRFHVSSHSSAILSIPASPNCTEIEDDAQNGDSGKSKPGILDMFDWCYNKRYKIVFRMRSIISFS